MARENYPDEFKGDAVALYRDTEGATITVIAGEDAWRRITAASQRFADYQSRPTGSCRSSL